MRQYFNILLRASCWTEIKISQNNFTKHIWERNLFNPFLWATLALFVFAHQANVVCYFYFYLISNVCSFIGHFPRSNFTFSFEASQWGVSKKVMSVKRCFAVNFHFNAREPYVCGIVLGINGRKQVSPEKKCERARIYHKRKILIFIDWETRINLMIKFSWNIAFLFGYRYFLQF